MARYSAPTAALQPSPRPSAPACTGEASRCAGYPSAIDTDMLAALVLMQVTAISSEIREAELRVVRGFAAARRRSAA
jgi:hypothetical protein